MTSILNRVKSAFKSSKPTDTRRIKMAVDTPNYSVNDDYTSAKMEMANAGPKAIARARDLVTNSPMPKAFYNVLCKYVVGDSGFTLRSRILMDDGNLDNKLNKQIEAAWVDFCKPKHISLSKNKSALDLSLNMVFSCVVSGDIFVRTVENDNWKYGLALQVLDPERISSPAIYSSDTFNGIRLNEYDEPLSYWFRKGENPLGYQFEYSEIPASQVIHTWLNLRPDSNRGLTPLAPIAANTYDIDAVRESTRANLRHHANLLALFTPKESTGFEPDGSSSADHEAQMTGMARRIGQHFQSNPGTFAIAPEGELKQLNPMHPVSNYSAFVDTENKIMCPAYGITPCLLLGDLAGTSYSASKSANQYDADTFKMWQTMFIQKVWNQIFEKWLILQLKRGTFGFTTEDELEIEEKFLKYRFHGRPFPMADQYKDAKAKEIMLANMLMSRSDILAADDKDFGELVKELVSENAQIESAGLRLLHAKAEPSSEEDSSLI